MMMKQREDEEEVKKTCKKNLEMIEEENHNLVIRGYLEGSTLRPDAAVNILLDKVLKPVSNRESYKECRLNIVKSNTGIDKIHLLILRFLNPILKAVFLKNIADTCTLSVKRSIPAPYREMHKNFVTASWMPYS